MRGKGKVGANYEGVRFLAACFTLLVAGAGSLIAVDNDHANLYVGVIALLSVISTIIVLGVLAQHADAPVQETYSRVMVALVAATAGTGGGIGGSAVVSQGPANKADAAQKTAQQAKTQATATQQTAQQAKTQATATQQTAQDAKTQATEARRRVSQLAAGSGGGP